MLKISRQQLINRRDSLPDNLREALFSEYNSETLWKICEGQHLSEDKIYIIATLAGDVILGFLHPEDLASEIKKDLNLVPELANLIASEIDRKIFTSIRSEIEKAYSPISEGEREERETKPTTDNLQLTTDNQQEMRDKAEPISMPIEIRKPEPPIKIIGFEEEKKEIQLMDSALPYREVPAENTQFQKEKETAAINEEPMIIHEETELKPLSESKKPLKSLSGLFGFLSGSTKFTTSKKNEKIEEPAPVKAEVNLDQRPTTDDQQLFKKEEKPTKIKVINYMEVPESVEADKRGLEIVEADLRGKETGAEIKVVGEIEPPIKIIEFEEEKKEIQLMDSALPYREVPVEDVRFQKEKETIVIKEEPIAVSPSTELRTGEAEPLVVSETEPLVVSETEPLVVSVVEPLIIPEKMEKPFLNRLFGFLKKKEKTDIQVIEEIPLLKEENNNEDIRLLKEEPPIRIIDNLQPTTNGKPLVVNEVEPLEMSNKEIKKEPIAELPSNSPIIITQETEPKPKKKFFGKLLGFFRRKEKSNDKSFKV